MTGVIKKFFTVSMLMWIAPIAILFRFNQNWLPGKIVVYLKNSILLFCTDICKWFVGFTNLYMIEYIIMDSAYLSFLVQQTLALVILIFCLQYCRFTFFVE